MLQMFVCVATLSALVLAAAVRGAEDGRGTASLNQELENRVREPDGPVGGDEQGIGSVLLFGIT